MRERNRQKTGAILVRSKRILEGHFNYYAVTDNGRMCDEFRRQLARMLYKWLNRRSQKRRYTWERFNDALRWVKWPSVRIKHQLDQFRREAPRRVEREQTAFGF